MRWFIGAYTVFVVAFAAACGVGLDADNPDIKWYGLLLAAVLLAFPGFLILISWIIVYGEYDGQRPSRRTRGILIGVTVVSAMLYLLDSYLLFGDLSRNRKTDMGISMALAAATFLLNCLVGLFGIVMAFGCIWFDDNPNAT